AEVGKLIIGHYSARYTDQSVLLNEASSVFQPVIAGQDMESYEI
ncbi:MAG TPA: ribonuclease Z, partial [Paludibacteraceae bacterium]|nr:ribonuclease Z [Paludibacteraceae bacterium]